jgi:hypothetical protein
MLDRDRKAKDRYTLIRGARVGAVSQHWLEVEPGSDKQDKARAAESLLSWCGEGRGGLPVAHVDWLRGE